MSVGGAAPKKLRFPVSEQREVALEAEHRDNRGVEAARFQALQIRPMAGSFPQYVTCGS